MVRLVPLAPEHFGLADLALALEDHSREHSWWLDPETGTVEPRFADPLDPRLIGIEPLPPAVGYRDMEEFVARVRDPRARELLSRAITGRGAFRRFKDALLDWPELRRAWFDFHDARGERRAIEWLLDRDLVDPALAEEELERRARPSLEAVPGLVDAEGVAHRVARELRRLYRNRLKEVVLAGPWAGGGVHPDSEVALVVVLDSSASRWEEKRRMDRIMWRYSNRHETVVTATPVSPRDLDPATSPWLAHALEGGVRIQ
jgi:Uncharacterised protein family (UPF0158)